MLLLQQGHGAANATEFKYKAEMERAEAKLAQAKTALTLVSVELAKMDTQLQDISAAHQTSDDKYAYSEQWREAKKRQAELKDEFEAKDQAMQVNFDSVTSS